MTELDPELGPALPLLVLLVCQLLQMVCQLLVCHLLQWYVNYSLGLSTIPDGLSIIPLVCHLFHQFFKYSFGLSTIFSETLITFVKKLVFRATSLKTTFCNRSPPNMYSSGSQQSQSSGSFQNLINIIFPFCSLRIGGVFLYETD